jgi:mono/diheme cytochrome c family protein
MKLLIVSLLGLALLVGCQQEQSEAPEPAPTPDQPPAEAPATPPAPEPPFPPAGDLRGDAGAGSLVYVQYCAICHGESGAGDGPAAADDPRPADHTDAAYMGSLSDADLYTVISKGGGSIGKSPLMAPWGSILTDEQIRDVIAHVRNLSGT